MIKKTSLILIGVLLNVFVFGITAPTNVSPSNGSTNTAVSVTIDWSSVTGNTGYIYQLDTTPLFNSTMLREESMPINQSQATMYDLFFGTTYYWRAAAKDGVDVSVWSPTWSFTTANSIVNVSPSNAAINQNVALTIDWSAITGNTGYLWQLDTVATFDSPLFLEGTSNINVSEAYLYDLYFGQTYYWRAAAKNAVDTSNWTTTWSFTTTNSIVNVSPSNAAINQNVALTIDWSGITGNTGYLFQLDTVASFNSPLFLEGTTNTNVSETYVTNLYFGTSYYWRAAAKNAVDTSNWTSTWSFTTANSIINLSPANGATNQNVAITFDWSSIVGNTGYLYQIDTVPTFDSPLFLEGTTNINSSDVSFTNLYFGTSYYWRAAAKNAVDTSNWTSTWSFTTANSIVNLSPANGATNQNVALSLDWSSITGNTGYLYQLDTVPTFDSPLFSEGTTSINNSDAYVTNLYFGTSYYWRSAAKTAVDTSEWTATWSFTTNNQVLNFTPSNGQTNISINPFIDWGNITGSTGYLLALDTSYNFNSDLYQEYSVASSQANISSLLYGTTYYWHAAARNAADTSAWSNTWSFTTAYELTESPLLVSPTNTSIDLSYSNVGFVWSSSTGAVNYHYQVSSNPDFSGIIKSAYTSLLTGDVNGLYPQTTYYWRVRGANANGHSPWSDTWIYTTESADLVAPVLVSPVNQATNIGTNTVILDWNSVFGAHSYIFEISQDNDFLVGVTTGQSDATFYEIIGLSSGSEYFWRVKSSDGVVESDWSEVWSFTTEYLVLNAPILVSPVDNSIDLDHSLVTLDWNSVAGASLYIYEYSTDESFSADVNSDIISATFIEITSLSADTEYFWRIKASDGVLESVWSEVWSFTTIIDNLEAPELASPSNNSTDLNFDILTLDWESVTNASSYSYEYSSDETFASNVQTAIIANTQIDIFSLEPETQYYWRVKALYETIESNWSEVWSFTTEAEQIQYTLTVTIEGCGIVSIDGIEYANPVVVDANTILTLQADFPLNCPFVQWTGDLTGSNWTETLLMDSDKHVFAEFVHVKDELINNQTPGLSVYPNPASNFIIFECENQTQITVIASSGQIVCDIKSDSDIYKLDISDYASGLYLVKVKSKKNIFSVRFVKE